MTWVQRMKGVLGLVETTTNEMKLMYKSKLLPLEKQYDFHVFHSPMFDDADFQAKPMILLVGQYSTGKTTFIRHLLKEDFPGLRVGPEPTTDRFIALMHGDQKGVIPGNALVEDREKPFRQLSKYGNKFLNRFQCSHLDSPVLKAMTMIDTPGILSGEIQRIDRGYDFTGVVKWFAERVDRVILLFDAHKLDISDEFKKSMEALRGHDDKIRIVLNKADMIDQQQLMRVYGALMWSLGKIFQTPEVSRVYIGSFWDQPLNFDVNKRLLEAEERDLLMELQTLPRDATLRKLNDLIKRARLARAHAYIISELRLQMPLIFGKETMKNHLINNLEDTYSLVVKKYEVSPGDLPDLKKMQDALWNKDFTKFSKLKPSLIGAVNKMLANDVPKINKLLFKEKLDSVSEPSVEGEWYVEIYIKIKFCSKQVEHSKMSRLIEAHHSAMAKVKASMLALKMSIIFATKTGNSLMLILKS